VRPHPGGGCHPPPSAGDDTALFRTQGCRFRDDFPECSLSSRRRDEPVRLTRIYTRAGDEGETSLGDGSRVRKLDCRIGAFGAVDELNSALGVVLTSPDLPDALRPPLERIQNDLFDVGADLSVPFGVTDRLRIEQAATDRLEVLCDEFNADLPDLKSFVLPGGTEAAARLHVARATCRRAERDALVAERETGVNPLVLAYLNRLSDFLFIAARAANAAAGRDEPLWKPGG
jgi:cob(I)alamin adenosyltransferase